MPLVRAFILLIIIGIIEGSFPASVLASFPTTVTLEKEITVSIIKGRRIEVAAKLKTEQEAIALAEKLLRPEISPTKYIHGATFKLPFSSLKESYQKTAIEALFPTDKLGSEGWVHKVRYADSRSKGETLWAIAEWFTGDGKNHQKLYHKRASRQSKGVLYLGDRVIIPRGLLQRAFLSSEENPAWGPEEASQRLLTYKTDSEGPYASYILKKGESIYSSVVIRFTGREKAADVTKAAEIIRRRSGIQDAASIVLGTEIKIPLYLLADIYKPMSDAEVAMYEREEKEAIKFTEERGKARFLRGVAIILDAGHGGKDTGAIGKGNIYEDECAYDIMCRIMKKLDEETDAQIYSTVFDRSRGYMPTNARSFSHDKDEYVRTTPPYLIEDPSIGATFRWYLVNSIYRNLIKEGTDPTKIIFSSIHADALHPYYDGTMIYYPSADLSKGTGGKNGKLFLKRKEVKDKQFVSLSYHDRRKSEALSKNFAYTILKALEKQGIVIHKDRPIRGNVVRDGKAWVPAVLRFNEIPTKVLIEVVNLNNHDDWKKIKEPFFRDQYAEAYVMALQNYFGN